MLVDDFLKRYWIEFEGNASELPAGFAYGCGVTAFSYDDAIKILVDRVFKDGALPKVKSWIENVDVSTLDAGHVLPNMMPPNYRGIWFPVNYLN